MTPTIQSGAQASAQVIEKRDRSQSWTHFDMTRVAMLSGFATLLCDWERYQ